MLYTADLISGVTQNRQAGYDHKHHQITIENSRSNFVAVRHLGILYRYHDKGRIHDVWQVLV